MHRGAAAAGAATVAPVARHYLTARDRASLSHRAACCHGAPQSLGDYVRLGSTLDDAVGEAFDKVARDLELPWMVDGVPAAPGAALEALASKGACTWRRLAARARA